MRRHKCTFAKHGKVGEVSSKYGYDKDGKQFEADIQASLDREEYLWRAFVSFMKEHAVDPRELRGMFTKYYNEYIK